LRVKAGVNPVTAAGMVLSVVPHDKQRPVRVLAAVEVLDEPPTVIRVAIYIP
jgi:hypothetical protein